VDSVLRFQGIANLRVMTCGLIPQSPAEVLASAEMDKVLTELRQHFQLIILDCPPALAFADARALGPRVDSTILVHQAGMGARGALRRAKEELTGAGIPVMGVVLNDLSADTPPSS